MNILIFGDSITQGFLDEERGGWVDRLHTDAIRRRIKSNFEDDISVFNLGISGDCTTRILKRFDFEARTRTKNGESDSVILFAVGVNDTQRYVNTNEIKTPKDKFQTNVENLHKQAKEYTDKVIFAGILPIVEEIVQPMPWADDRSHFSKDIEAYNQIIKGHCDNEHCLFIPMQDIYSKFDLREVLQDGIHPNAEGHRLIFERVRDVLEQENIL